MPLADTLRWAAAEPGPRRVVAGVGLGLVTAAVAAHGAHGSGAALRYLLAAAVVVAVAVRPGPALAGLLGWLPVSLVALSLLYHYGAPAPALRALGAVKDAVVIGLVLAVARRRRDERRWDGVDALAFAYLALVTLYLAAPAAVPGLLGHAVFPVRLLAWRNDALFVALFVVARHAAIDPDWRRRVRGTVIVTGLLLSACALYEVAAPGSWAHFMGDVARVHTFQHDVLGGKPAAGGVLTYTDVAGQQVLRAGSLMADPLTLPFYLLVPFGLLLAALTRGRHSLPAAAGVLVIGAAIIATLTRSAILGALFGIVAALVLAARRRSRGRIGLALLLTATLAVAVPVVASTTLAGRLGEATNGANVDTAGHLNSSVQGFWIAVEHPLGRGLGTVAGTGQRFSVSGTVVAENSYLQVADELGVVPMLLFMSLLVVVLRRLYLTAREDRDPWLAGGLFAAGFGLVVGGLLLQVWLDYSTSLSLWGAAGLALARGSAREDPLVEGDGLLGSALPGELRGAAPPALAQARA